VKALVFLILIVNPMQDGNPALGPNNDWAPLKAEYAACGAAATGYFSYIVCTLGAMDRAMHPVTKA
jgi:hypothetical protein